jgi:hypothetical protein
MKSILLTILVAILLSIAAQASRFEDLAGRSAEPIAAALAQVGLTPEEVTFDFADMGFYGGDRYRLQAFDAFAGNPWKIPGYVETFRRSAFENAANPGKLMQVAQGRTGNAVRLGLIGDPLEPYIARADALPAGEAMVDSIKGLYQYLGDDLSADEQSYLTQTVPTVPEPVAKAAALFFFTLPEVLAYRDAALYPVRTRLQTLDTPDAAKLLYGWMTQESELSGLEAATRASEMDLLIEDLLDELDFNYLNTGATLLAYAAGKVRDMLKETPPTGEYSFVFDTPLGMIALNGAQTDSYSAFLPYLLVIDTGGNDAYAGGAANLNLASPVSVTIDLSGDDTYESTTEDAPSFGAGVFGYGYLLDCAGNDTYKAVHYSQGAGLFGVGLLLDEAGDDHYSAVTSSQASGTFGTGILSDLAGADSYDCYAYSQGYGFTMGVGLLVDLQGDDRYTANDEDIKYPSAQSQEHNGSLSQGFGFGKRGDYNTGHSWAGGVGMLFDSAGNDGYSCGVFGQGAGYWYGVGILSDAAGDDSYTGHWYVQASAAHFAIGILDDAAGNDHYFADMNMAQGAGHDFSLGFLVERAGNDTYDAPNLSLGGGNANGIGVFWDFAGDDTYNVSAATTFGRDNNGPRGGLRDFIRGLGLFIDTGGNDTYPAAYPFAGNNKMWTQRGTDESNPLPLTELGAGVDTEVPMS